MTARSHHYLSDNIYTFSIVRLILNGKQNRQIYIPTLLANISDCLQAERFRKRDAPMVVMMADPR